MSNDEQEIYEFGHFQLDIGKGVLMREGQVVVLQWKAFELLCLLVKSGGNLVTRGEAMDELWADTFVEDNNVSQHIGSLRKALGENGNGNGNADGSKYIQTVAGRGYRFLPEVKAVKVLETSAKPRSQNGDIEAPEFSLSENSGVNPSHEKNVKNGGKIGSKYPAQWGIVNRSWPSAIVAAVILTTAFGLYFYSGSGAVLQPIRSIAVLPMKSHDPDADDAELRSRITDALTTKLGGLRDVAIRPTDSVLRFSKSEESIVEIGKKLRVDAVLDGRIQQEGGRIRVTLQLVSVGSGKQIWSEQFDGQADQILNFQDAISERVLQTLNQNRQQTLEFRARPTENTEAYEAYLKARFFARQMNGRESLYKSIDFYKRAIEFDPQFADGFGGLAGAQFRLYSGGFDTSRENIAQAKENLQKALSINPGSVEASLTLGNIQMLLDWDWANAEKTFKHAVETAPNSVGARISYGVLLTHLRRYDLAQAQLEQAVRLDPTYAGAISNLGMVYYCKKDYVQAEQQFRKALEFDEKWTFAHMMMWNSLWMQGKKAESIKYIISSFDSANGQLLARKVEEKARTSGPNDVIHFIIDELNSGSTKPNSYSLAVWTMSVGDNQKALGWLEKAFEEHLPWTIAISAMPNFGQLHAEPRFQEILRKMKLD